MGLPLGRLVYEGFSRDMLEVARDEMAARARGAKESLPENWGFYDEGGSFVSLRFDGLR